MIGAIIGDIVGSIYEFDNIKTKEFPLFTKDCFFTDDTVLTVATAQQLLETKSKWFIDTDYAAAYRQWGLQYPLAGYGAKFEEWLCSSNQEPYSGRGNGAAMRVSPVGETQNTLNNVLQEAKQTASVTHNHPEGIMGAQITALAGYYARLSQYPSNGKTRTLPSLSLQDIKRELVRVIQIKQWDKSCSESVAAAYDLNRKLSDIRPVYTFDESCTRTVPVAIIAFMESTGFEDAIRNAVSLGGDSDTIACITGGIAGAYYGVPKPIAAKAMSYLPIEITKIIEAYQEEFPWTKPIEEIKS